MTLLLLILLPTVLANEIFMMMGMVCVACPGSREGNYEGCEEWHAADPFCGGGRRRMSSFESETASNGVCTEIMAHVKSNHRGTALKMILEEGSNKQLVEDALIETTKWIDSLKHSGNEATEAFRAQARGYLVAGTAVARDMEEESAALQGLLAAFGNEDEGQAACIKFVEDVNEKLIDSEETVPGLHYVHKEKKGQIVWVEPSLLESMGLQQSTFSLLLLQGVNVLLLFSRCIRTIGGPTQCVAPGLAD